MDTIVLLMFAQVFIAQYQCQTVPTLPPNLPDVDWGDYLHPPRTAKKYRGGESTWVITHGTKDYDNTWYSIEDRNSVVLSVKACTSAFVALSDAVGISDMMIEIGIGINDNTESVIRYPFEVGSLFTQQTPGLLHCNEYRQFWIKWGADVIAVGRGPVVGDEKFMNYVVKAPEYFIGLGLISGDGNSAAWQLQENAGDYVWTHTPSVHRYTNVWKQVEQKRYFTFSVQACGHAHVLLSENIGDQENNIYEIVIGGWDNEKSGIRKVIRGPLLAEYNQQGILSCSEMRDFWIGWANNTVELGRGQRYGHNRIVRYRDTENPVQVRYLALTSGFGAHGYWLFDDTLSSTNIIETYKADTTTPETKYNSTWFHTDSQRWMTFSVKTCSEASIVFTQKYGLNSADPAYEVVLGYYANEKSGIRSTYGGAWLVETDTKDILKCEHLQHFWVSWINGTLKVGRGFVFGLGEFMHFDMGKDYYVRSYSFATPIEGGEWRVRETFGDQINLKTPTEFGLNYLWRSMPQNNMIAFRVKACSDVHVILSPTVGVDYAEDYYDIIISGWSNTKTVIRQVHGTSGQEREVSNPADTTNLLSCDRHVNLYVSWEGRQVTIGQGQLSAQYIILQHVFDNWDPPKAVSFSSGWGSTADWYINEDQGDQLYIFTNYNVWYTDKHPRYHLQLIPHIYYKVFDLRTCFAAQVNLTEVTDQGEHVNTWQILIGIEENTKSSIVNPDGVAVETVSTNNLLHCDNSRHFWVSWSNGKIEAGEGTAHGHRTFISASLSSTTFEPAVIGFDTLEDQYGRWIVRHSAAFNAEMYTPIDKGYFYMWSSLEHKEYLTFTVKACSDVHIALADGLSFDIDQHAYEIVIGGWSNSLSAIIHNRINRISVSTPNILNCNESIPVSQFWITWRGGTLVVGKGLILGDQRIMSYSPVNPPENIKMAGFSTGYGHEGYWIIPLLDVVLSPPVTESPPYKDPDQKLSSGAIAGIVIGCMALILISTVVTLFLLIRMGKLEPSQVPGAETLQEITTPPIDRTPIVEEANFENPNFAQEIDEASTA